jgi:hypothetical protein
VDKLFKLTTKSPDENRSSDKGLINIKNNVDKWRFFNKLNTKHLLSKREQKIVDDGVESVRAIREAEFQQEVQNGSAIDAVDLIATTSPVDHDEAAAQEVEVAIRVEEEDAEETEAEPASDAAEADNIESDDTVHGIN